MEMTDRQKKDLSQNDFVVIEDNKPEKCIDCPLNRVCQYAFEIDGKIRRDSMDRAVCYYEVKGDYKEKRDLFNQWQSFVDMDPKYFLEKMMMNYKVLEEEAKNDSSFAKWMQLNYLLMSIHKMKFGDRQIVENRTLNVSGDIQKLLDKVRDEKE